MAYETELANYITIGNAVSALASPAFAEKTIMLNLCTVEQYPDNTNVIKAQKKGSLTAEDVTESTAYSLSASSELTDSSVSCTAVKGVVASQISVEALRFANPASRIARIGEEQGAALGRLFDTAAVALFSSVATGVTATNTLTKDNLLDGQYNVFAAMKGAVGDGKLAAVLHYKGANEIRKELTSISASAFANGAMLSLIKGAPKAHGLVEEFAGMEVYHTSGLPTSGGDNIQLVFHPQFAFFDGLGGAIETEVLWKGATGGSLWEISSHMFYKVVEWNDTAACKVLSDS